MVVGKERALRALLGFGLRVRQTQQKPQQCRDGAQISLRLSVVEWCQIREKVAIGGNPGPMDFRGHERKAQRALDLVVVGRITPQDS